jgi:hypothetical protein
VKDPTANEGYVALRNALLAMQDDASAVHSMLSSRSDGGASWVSTAYYELRRSLVEGRLREAETLGKLIGTVLDIREQGASDELAENRLHRDAMQYLIDGIGAILAQDIDTGIQNLERLTEAVYCNESLQWVAWLWTAKASTEKGDLPRARKAADAALGLAERLGPVAHGTTLCTVAETEFLSGVQEPALLHLSMASNAFDEVEDARGKATASLTRARMLGRMKRDDEAVEAARQAQVADADWEDPAIYLSEWLLGRELADAAEEVLRPFVESEPVPPSARRQMQLIEAFRKGHVPGAAIRSFLDFKDRVPADADLPAMKMLWEQCRGFEAQRELLAWNLSKLGHDDDARQHFEELAATGTNAEVRESALLGLGCLANRRFGHRQSSARVRAAASASVRPVTGPEAPIPRFASLHGQPLDRLIASEGPEPATARDAGWPHIETSKRHAHADATPVQPIPASPAEAVTMPLPIIPVPTQSRLASKSGEGSRGAAKAASAPASVSAPKAVFTGDLQLLAAPDLLEFLKSSRRTGTLVITSSGGLGAVHMRQGMITGAASPNSKNMGQILQESGQVTADQLKESAEYQRANSPNRLFGSILVERGVVDRAALQNALIRQIKGAILEMVQWKSGRFAFEPDKRGQVDESDVEVELDTQAVLLDVLRELDEANRDKEEGGGDETAAIDETAADTI